MKSFKQSLNVEESTRNNQTKGSEMTDQELTQHIRTNSKFNRARMILRSYNELSNFDLPLNEIKARLEFEAVEKILALYGIDPKQG